MKVCWGQVLNLEFDATKFKIQDLTPVVLMRYVYFLHRGYPDWEFE